MDLLSCRQWVGRGLRWPLLRVRVRHLRFCAQRGMTDRERTRGELTPVEATPSTACTMAQDVHLIVHLPQWIVVSVPTVQLCGAFD
jgi:hypothetical protein